MGSGASLRADMAHREVIQFALQPRVLVRSVRVCAGGRARYGSRVEGVRFRCEEAMAVMWRRVWYDPSNCAGTGSIEVAAPRTANLSFSTSARKAEVKSATSAGEDLVTSGVDSIKSEVGQSNQGEWVNEID